MFGRSFLTENAVTMPSNTDNYIFATLNKSEPFRRFQWPGTLSFYILPYWILIRDVCFDEREEDDVAMY